MLYFPYRLYKNSSSMYVLFFLKCVPKDKWSLDSTACSPSMEDMCGWRPKEQSSTIHATCSLSASSASTMFWGKSAGIPNEGYLNRRVPFPGYPVSLGGLEYEFLKVYHSRFPYVNKDLSQLSVGITELKPHADCEASSLCSWIICELAKQQEEIL